VQNGAAATDRAVAQVTQTVAATDFMQTSTVAGDTLTRSASALTRIVQTAAGKAQELCDGCAAEFKKIAGPTVEYRQAGHYLGDPTAWV
jgi:hypothetical protein